MKRRAYNQPLFKDHLKRLQDLRKTLLSSQGRIGLTVQ